jgi:hypothetical protein
MLFPTSLLAYSAVGVLMKAFGTVLASALLVAGCAQVIDQGTLRRISMRNPSKPIFRNVKIEVRRSLRCANGDDSKARTHNEMVPECKIPKGYIVQFETK